VELITFCSLIKTVDTVAMETIGTLDEMQKHYSTSSGKTLGVTPLY